MTFSRLATLPFMAKKFAKPPRWSTDWDMMHLPPQMWTRRFCYPHGFARNDVLTPNSRSKDIRFDQKPGLSWCKLLSQIGVQQMSCQKAEHTLITSCSVWRSNQRHPSKSACHKFPLHRLPQSVGSILLILHKEGSRSILHLATSHYILPYLTISLLFSWQEMHLGFPPQLF